MQTQTQADRSRDGGLDKQYHNPSPTGTAKSAYMAALAAMSAAGIAKLENVRVKHCPESYGVRVEISEALASHHMHTETQTEDIQNAGLQGDINDDILMLLDRDRQQLQTLSLVYSGDCRPCASLVRLAMHCDVLIHEVHICVYVYMCICVYVYMRSFCACVFCVFMCLRMYVRCWCFGCELRLIFNFSPVRPCAT